MDAGATCALDGDRPCELAGHERVDDREAQPGRPLQREADRKSDAVIDDVDQEVTPLPLEVHGHRPGSEAGRRGEPVIDGVLHQLVDHDGERRRDVTGEDAGVALDREA